MGFSYDALQKMQQFLDQGGCLVDISDIPYETLDMLYKYGHQLYEEKNYLAAQPIFFSLTLLEHLNFDFTLALGMCTQKLQQYDRSILYFSRAALMRLDDPRPTYFLGISYEGLEDKEKALTSYQIALQWCVAHPEMNLIREAIEQRLTLLQKGAMHANKQSGNE